MMKNILKLNKRIPFWSNKFTSKSRFKQRKSKKKLKAYIKMDRKIIKFNDIETKTNFTNIKVLFW